MRVAINGAGIAGTALAYWLGRMGHEVVLVERAPQLRTGGYVLNLWGVGYDAMEKMGLLPKLLELQYETDELRMVDRHGRTRGGYPSKVLQSLANGRIATLARADIAAAIYGLLDDRVETIFGDSIVTIDDDGTHARVGFEHAPQREVDLVIGADGLHSKIRQITFGPDSLFEYPMGCHVASFEVAGYRPRDENLYVAHSAPGRYVARFPVRDDKTLFFMLLRDEYLTGTLPVTESERKAAIVTAFSDMGWECPGILSQLETTDGIYFDSISQIRMDGWAKGRVVLAGDAAACPSLIAGEGAGLALAEAYVLAGEIHGHGADLDSALEHYERRIKPYAARKQRYAESMVPSFVPKTELGIGVRDLATLLMRLPGFPRLLMGRYFRDAMELPEYAMPCPEAQTPPNNSFVPTPLRGAA
ncbi:FAD-binding domain [Lysobacter sp. A3-1-A15]|uniref:FAD-binding domain n=1 Tax=Novilysobacter viscosus TaxID=3098602 RepID=UPI002EDA9A56